MRNEKKLTQSQVTTANGKKFCKHTQLLPGSQKGDALFFYVLSPSGYTETCRQEAALEKSPTNPPLPTSRHQVTPTSVRLEVKYPSLDDEL